MRERSTPTAAQHSHNPIVRYFRVLGPGLVTGAADDDPSGITAYSVARRTNEIGVRTALGATRGQVVGLILRSAMAQAGVGLAIGIPAALAEWLVPRKVTITSSPRATRSIQ